ncbi:helix-turn-helix transcriptional regulator [Ferrovibrio sp.]|uniref:helix-turn-helix transcriptional regulator n=1 Tax=Ferrovibrio sp. TaxID=1917215 RepID=UPI00353037DC
MPELKRSPEHPPTKQLAARLGVHDNTLRKWRIAGLGPPFIKLGKHVVYRRWTVEAWLSKHARTNTIVARTTRLKW